MIATYETRKIADNVERSQHAQRCSCDPRRHDEVKAQAARNTPLSAFKRGIQMGKDLQKIHG